MQVTKEDKGIRAKEMADKEVLPADEQLQKTKQTSKKVLFHTL